MAAKPEELKWPTSDKVELAALKTLFAKPIPKINWQMPFPDFHKDRPEEEYESLKAQCRANEELYKKRVICRVSRIASLIVSKQFQGIQVDPNFSGMHIPADKWTALPLAVIEVLERAYIAPDPVATKRKNVDPDTTTLGMKYKYYKVWEYRVERWDMEKGESYEIPREKKPVADASEDDN